MKKIVDLKLPEFAFLDVSPHQDNILEGRTVILHTPTASVIEIGDVRDLIVNEDVKTLHFSHYEEELIAALHYSVAVEDIDEKNDILRLAADWYCEYADWEDSNDDNIIESMFN